MSALKSMIVLPDLLEKKVLHIATSYNMTPENILAVALENLLHDLEGVKIWDGKPNGIYSEATVN
jgi:hypothetical protein